MNDNRKIPVAYEEVILNIEAVETLEKERKAALERPGRKLRRLLLAPQRERTRPPGQDKPLSGCEGSSR